MTSVDIVLLTRDFSPLDRRVTAGIESQRGVQISVHRVIGSVEPGDRNRLDTIARARNRAKAMGQSELLMFLDDDVALHPGSVPRLVEFLAWHADHGAVAANYQGHWSAIQTPDHVAMGATLFRRAALTPLHFRWERHLCECLCCCYDMRSLGYQIDYAPGVYADHLHNAARRDDVQGSESLTNSPSTAAPSSDFTSADTSIANLVAAADGLKGVVLTCFNQRDFGLFRSQFLPTLRASGNDGLVIAIAYGLSHNQLMWLEQTPGIAVVPRLSSAASPARSRLWDLQLALQSLPNTQPVAYWDAGDVVFQSSLDPLWRQCEQAGSHVLVAPEPLEYAHNVAMQHWANTIHDEANRRLVDRRLAECPVLNGGFAAGTAHGLMGYLRAASNLLDSPTLFGSIDATDQLAMNVACHFELCPSQLVSDDWNFCLFGRPASHFRIARARGRGDCIVRSSGRLIPVVHGNAQTGTSLFGQLVYVSGT